jgi:hypothetical protein
MARSLSGSRTSFQQSDAQTYRPQRQYDIVLMLAVLQKLRNPSRICKRFARAARKLVVMRLPADGGPVIVDKRSAYARHDMEEVMVREGFMLELVTAGPFDEWTGYWRRNV